MIDANELKCRFCLKDLVPREIMEKSIFYRCTSCRTQIKGAPNGWVHHSMFGINYFHEEIIKIVLAIDQYIITYRALTNQTIIDKMTFNQNKDPQFIELFRKDGDLFKDVSNDQLEKKLNLLLAFS